MRRLFWIPTLALLAAACASTPSAPPAPPELMREFRGVWVATVKNIDWPSRPGLTAAEQQRELVAIFDRAKELGLNAIIFQVRPAADALYRSEIEPWSEYLSGTMGEDPGWDPLEFAVTEAHARGMELHAWFNPYRARHREPERPPSATHVSVTHPHLVKRYGEYLWLDPGEDEVIRRTRDVILDVVRRYEVDGVHLDDYFYPYPVTDDAGAPLEFPDDESWQRYLAAGGTDSRGDWRRGNVNRLVRELWLDIHRVKPLVKFGISPFGIWRPGTPAGIEGFDAWEKLYADSRLWLERGWVDYFAPQLYWPIEQKAQSFPVLLRWWTENNPQGRHLWPGVATSRIANGAPNAVYPEQILHQIALTRELGAWGAIHFSAKPLMEDRAAIARRLSSTLYAEPALVPASPWLDSDPPTPPRVSWGTGDLIALAPGSAGDDPFLWAVRVRRGSRWVTDIVSGAVRDLAVGSGAEEVAVTAVDHAGNESRMTRLARPPA